MSALEAWVREVPRGPLLLVACLFAVLFQVGVLLAPRRREAARAPDLRLNVLGALAILALLAVGVHCVHLSRQLVTSVLVPGDASQKATALSLGLSGQMNALPMMSSAAMLAAILWLIGLNRELERRPTVASRRAFTAFAVFGGTTILTAAAVVRWTAARIRVFAGLAGLEPDAKAPLLSRAIDESHELLHGDARVAYVAIGLATLVAIVLAARRDPDAVATPSSPRSATVASLLLTAVALGGAAWLFTLAGPLRRENAEPWPPNASGDDLLLVLDPVTPDVQGPDAVERAHVVQVFNDNLLLDGAACDPSSLDDRLRTLRRNVELLHPGTPFDGTVILVVDYSLPIERFVAVGHALHDAGYEHPVLAFTKLQTVRRPVFGKLRRVLSTGARLELLDRYDVDAAGADVARHGTLLDPADLDIYDDLAKKVVALRRAGGAVALNLGKPAAP